MIGLDAELGSRCSRLTFGLVIEGNSMAPEFAPGDLVIIDPEIRPVPGDYVVAKLDAEERATFKKFRHRGTDANGAEQFDLVPLNEDWPTIEVRASNPGYVVGVMVEHRRKRRTR